MLTSGSEANDLAWRIARAAAAAADPDDSRPLHVAVVSGATGEGKRGEVQLQRLKPRCLHPLHPHAK